MNTRPIRIAILLVICAALNLCLPAIGRSADDDNPPAPDFTGADGWLNTEKPISIADLKGQVVIVDFWTYCCINCMHIMPDLKYLEEKYKNDPVVIIGVHSGKFDEEKDADHIRQAVLRHNLSHPIAIDSESKIWEAYGAHSWPTLVVIAPDGTVVGAVSGEGHRENLDHAVAALLDRYGKEKKLGKHLTFRTERSSFKSGELEFPGKVLADAPGGRLFVSDTNHHRIVIADLDGKIQQTIGTGAIGLKDGSFTQAEFYQPQGLALSADCKTLYVADTENHALRAVDLEKKSVTTLAGNGKQGSRDQIEGPGAQVRLSSPWDLARVGNRLYIAMAGTHQIYVMDLATHVVSRFAGAGRERDLDGPNLQACFAQPSGLTTDGKMLYVADSEVSSIRSVELAENGNAVTLAGSGDLFGFGLKDGNAAAARFQHPLGVALSGETLYVADTFNNAIRTVSVKDGQTHTFLGNGKKDAGTPDAIGFYEPGGLSIAGNTLYVADTNHHRLIAVDLKTKKAKILIGGGKAE
ncbi:MAG TPA: thioredoxin-like domain-containing protein [Tepidisphaeraceae bacterium]|jgi:sugar lactone lactonase YvrE/peroxiredoxin|nr:thioredoxin-like domain-containing protein [Tepidisphaeraceae bacterium]